MSVAAFYKGILKSDFDEILYRFKDINSQDLDIMGHLAARYGLNFKFKNFDAALFTKKLFETAYNNLQTDEKHYLDCALELIGSNKCVSDRMLEAGVCSASTLVDFLKTDAMR